METFGGLVVFSLILIPSLLALAHPRAASHKHAKLTVFDEKHKVLEKKGDDTDVEDVVENIRIDFRQKRSIVDFDGDGDRLDMPTIEAEEVVRELEDIREPMNKEGK